MAGLEAFKVAIFAPNMTKIKSRPNFKPKIWWVNFNNAYLGSTMQNFITIGAYLARLQSASILIKYQQTWLYWIISFARGFQSCLLSETGPNQIFWLNQHQNL